MQQIQPFGPKLAIAGKVAILKDEAGKAVFDVNANGRVDDLDCYVLTQNSIEGCTGHVPTSYESLQAHCGSLGRASSAEVAESMTRYEWAGSAGSVTDILPARDIVPGLHSTVFHFETDSPYAEFIVAR
jgi:hypothetical protein